MRYVCTILMLVVLSGFGLAAPVAGQTAPPAAGLEVGFARPGGTYLTPPAATAEACARACSEDALCMAFTFYAYESAPRCELKAVIPRPRTDPTATAGLSHRAPAFARLVAGDPPLPNPALPLTPPVMPGPAVQVAGDAAPPVETPVAGPAPAPAPPASPVSSPALAAADVPITLTPAPPQDLPLRNRLPGPIP
jgi:hypothetical protein